MAARCRALGVPVTGRQLITAVIRSPDGGAGLLAQARVLDLAEALADACRTERIPALVGSLDDVRAGALLSADAGADPEQVLAGVCAAARLALARRARRPYGMPSGEPVIGVGTPASSMREARRSLLEARQVADAAADSSRRDRRTAGPSTAWPTCGCAACSRCSAGTPGWPRSWTGNWGRCAIMTPRTALT